MKKERAKAPGILPVPRPKEEAKQFYDRISRVYDYLTAAFERRYAEMALARLGVEESETVLEIGFGSGHCLKQIAESVGKTGKAYGVDISSGMLKVTRRRLEKAKVIDRVELHCGDAASLPYRDSTFDAVFMSYTLELFDTPEIPTVLQEVKRVLKPGGRLGVASMSKENGESTMLRLYEWAHQKWPKYLDCRPIYVEQSMRDAGYEITMRESLKLFGLPTEIVVAKSLPAGYGADRRCSGKVSSLQGCDGDQAPAVGFSERSGQGSKESDGRIGRRPWVIRWRSKAPHRPDTPRCAYIGLVLTTWT